MNKTCPGCGINKPEEEFYKCRRSSDGLQGYCIVCHKQKTLDGKAKNPEKHRQQKKQWYQKNRESVLLHYETKAETRRETAKQWAKANPERMRELQKDFRDKQDPLVKRYKRFIQTLHRHGLTLNQYFDIAEKQHFCCALCGEPPVPVKETYTNGFVIDHDHVTNQVRSLTCHPCNVALGQLRDDPEIARKAANYLDYHHSRRV